MALQIPPVAIGGHGIANIGEREAAKQVAAQCSKENIRRQLVLSLTMPVLAADGGKERFQELTWDDFVVTDTVLR